MNQKTYQKVFVISSTKLISLYHVSTTVLTCDVYVGILCLSIIIIIITVFIVRGLQDWPMAHYNCSYGVEMHVKNKEK